MVKALAFRGQRPLKKQGPLMKTYHCKSCWGTDGGKCKATLDGAMLDITVCPVTGKQEAEWMLNTPNESQPQGDS